jgi:hypothetical protein
LHNFLTTQSIHTNSNSIDASRQAAYDAKLNMSKFQSRGAQFSRQFPEGNFPDINQNVFVTFERVKMARNVNVRLRGIQVPGIER